MIRLLSTTTDFANFVAAALKPAAEIKRTTLSTLAKRATVGRVVIGFIAVLGGIFAAPAVARADRGGIIGIHDVPQDIKQVAEEMATNIDWLLAFKFENDGKPFYRLVGKDSQLRTVCANIWVDGRPLEFRTHINLREMPEAARNTLTTRHSEFEPADEGLTTQAVGLNDREVLYYRVEGKTRDQKSLVILVSPDGKDTKLESNYFEFKRAAFAAGQFSVEMPGKFKVEAINLGKGIIEHRYTAENGDGRIAFQVSYIDVPHSAGATLANPVGALKGYRDTVYKPELIVSDKQIWSDNTPGLECVYDASPSTEVRLRMYTAGWRIYQLTVAAPKDEKFIASADAERFFNSFELTQ